MIDSKSPKETLGPDLIRLINENVEDNNLKSILIKFTEKCTLHIDTLLQDESESSRRLYVLTTNFITLTQVICSMSLLKTLDDLNWNFFCYVFNNKDLCTELAINLTEPYEDSYLYKKIKKKYHKEEFSLFCYYLYSFYRYVYDLNEYNNLDNIKEIGNYYNIFITDIVNKVGLLRVSSKSNNKQFLEKIYSLYPIGCKYNDIIVPTIPADYKMHPRSYYLLNSNKFMRDIFYDFISNFDNINKAKKSVLLFVHFFSESCNNNMPSSLVEFNDDLFEIQFKYFSNLNSMYTNEIINSYGLTTILLYFYRFLIDLSYQSDVLIGMSNQLQVALQQKLFINYYTKGYKFIYHNKFEDYPSYDKVCLLPSTQIMNNAHAKNNLAMYYDISEFNDKYKDDVKEFIWNTEGYLRTVINYLSHLKGFLELRESFDLQLSNLNKSYDDCEFSINFLTYFRNIIELDYPNTMSQKGILKIIRSYLNFHKNKYKVKKNHLDVLNLKKLDIKRDIVTITDHDLDIIYNEFIKLQENEISRLHTLAFEIFIHTNLRIGSILNLRRDCLEYNEDKTIITLTYLSKTSDQEYVTQRITPSVAEVIEKALDITKPFISNVKPSDPLIEYVFVHKYVTGRRNTLKRLSFYNYFKNIVNSLSDKLDRTDYYPYNIRHTYMTTTFKNGVKLGLKVNELTAITEISYKTANVYYRNIEDTIKLYVETMSKVKFNDVNIKGEILDSECKNKLKTSPVKNNLGECKTSNCILGSGECLSCDSFVTFVNRIPQFQYAIVDCDRKIQNTDNPLKKELYINQKKLLAAYLSKMIRLSERNGN